MKPLFLVFFSLINVSFLVGCYKHQHIQESSPTLVLYQSEQVLQNHKKGYLEVNKALNSNHLGTISIYYEIILPPRQQPPLGTIIAYSGSQGTEGVRSFKQEILPNLPSVVRQNFQILIFDPRGTGKSTFASEIRAIEKFRDDYTIDQKQLEGITPYISTAHITEDIKAMKAQLLADEDKVFFYGASYGASIFLNYSILYPQDIKALLLDSPISFEKSLNISSTAPQGANEKLSKKLYFEQADSMPVTQDYQNFKHFVKLHQLQYQGQIEQLKLTKIPLLCHDNPNLDICRKYKEIPLSTSKNLKLDLKQAGKTIAVPIFIMLDQFDAEVPSAAGKALIQTLLKHRANVHQVYAINSISHGNLFTRQNQEEINAMAAQYLMQRLNQEPFSSLKEMTNETKCIASNQDQMMWVYTCDMIEESEAFMQDLIQRYHDRLESHASANTPKQK